MTRDDERDREIVAAIVRDPRPMTAKTAIVAFIDATLAELATVTDWMQRLLAEESPLPVLTLLAESGRTKKIRNVAANRARRRA